MKDTSQKESTLLLLQKVVDNYQRLARLNPKSFDYQKKLVFAQMDLHNFNNRQKVLLNKKQSESSLIIDYLYRKYYPKAL